MLKKKYVKKACCVDGCNSQTQIKGHCKKHYREIVLGIVKTPKEKRVTIPRRKVKVPCEVEHCDRFAQTKDMCKMHYQRVKRHGDPGTNYHRKYRSTLISVDNVLRPHMTHFSTADEKEALNEMFQEKSGYRESADIYY